MTVIFIIPAVVVIAVLVLLLRRPHPPVVQSLAASRHGVTGAVSSGDSWRVLWTNLQRVEAWRDPFGQAGVVVRLETVDLRRYVTTARDMGWDAFVQALTAQFDLDPEWPAAVRRTPIPEERVVLWEATV